MGTEKEKQTRIIAFCTDCGRETHHEVLYTHNQFPPAEYDSYSESKYSIIKCCGCDNVSFLYEYHDYENHIVDDDTGQETYEIDRQQFPRLIRGYQGLKETGYLPEIIRRIYNETLDALKNGNLILAGIGLRATIEAITKQENIAGKNLDTKINNLVKKGYLAKNDADRLHAIRFLGNDSAHEIMAYEQNKVILCFEIIENVLKSLYILDQKTEYFLEMPVKDYDEFLRLVRSKLEYKKYRESSNDFTLRSLLGKDLRKTLDKMNQYEQQLIKDIEEGKFNQLIISKKELNDKGKEVVYFKVKLEEL